jgi:hypothetical protein
MKKFANVATFLIFGLALFHAYGVASLLYHLCRGTSAEMPIFGVYTVEDLPESKLMMHNATVLVALLFFTILLRHLANGLRQLNLRAWVLSTSVCLTYIVVRLATGHGRLEAFCLVAYCVLILILLLLAAPIFKSNTAMASTTE